MGTGLVHYIPFVAYLGFWVMSLVSLTGRPLLGFYYMIPFVPYRTMRDHFLDYPLGGNVLTILVASVVIGGLLYGKPLPKSKLYIIWLVTAVYLYLSMWFGALIGNAPPPLWVGDPNFMVWKDYMLIPLMFVAASLVVKDRKAVRTVIAITAFTVLAIDRSCLMDSMTHTWANFDENKRGGGPLGYGSNQTAAFLAQFAMFFWGFTKFVKTKKYKIMGYGLVGITVLADLYTFSRGSYLALFGGLVVLALLQDRKLLVLGAVFLFTWQIVLPNAVQQRISMTESSNGKLEASAEERVLLLEEAQRYILSDPIFGNGFATYFLGQHVDGLKDTHDWYLKVMVETGIIGLILTLIMLQQLVALAYRLYKRSIDPLYRGLGLGLLLAIVACLIANCFGDRWTYIEITGPIWILAGTAACALEFRHDESTQAMHMAEEVTVNPYMAYR